MPYSKEFYQAHREEIQKKCHEWRERKGLLKPRNLICPVCKKEFFRKGRGRKNYCSIKCRSKAENARYLKQYKTLVFQLLGNKCNNPSCPISPEKMDPRALQVDHINGGGTKERKAIKGTSGFRMKFIYERLLEGSKEYQLLCAYCNWIKRYEKNEHFKIC